MTTRAMLAHLRRVAPAATLVSLAAALAATGAFARVILNTIDSVATVTDNGRLVVATGPLSCTEGERAYLRVTLSQRDTGAVAEGHTFVDCTGEVQQWEVHAFIQGRDTFVEGPATAVAIARTTVRGTSSDAHQWLVNVTLVGD